MRRAVRVWAPLNAAVQVALSVGFWWGMGTIPYFSAPFGAVCLVATAWAWLTKDKKEESDMGCGICGGAHPTHLCVPPGLVPYQMQAMNAARGQLMSISAGVIGGSVSLGYPTVMPNVSVEDRAEPVYGWRMYRLMPGGLLVGQRSEWPEREFRAVCDPSGTSAEMVKDILSDDVVYRLWVERRKDGPARVCEEHLASGTCSCGVYLRAKPEMYDYGFNIAAKALAYGVVAVDEDGNARASRVRIEALYVVKDTSDPNIPWAEYIDWERIGNVLRGRYDVPVSVIPSLEALTESDPSSPFPERKR